MNTTKEVRDLRKALQNQNISKRWHVILSEGNNSFALIGKTTFTISTAGRRDYCTICIGESEYYKITRNRIKLTQRSIAGHQYKYKLWLKLMITAGSWYTKTLKITTKRKNIDVKQIDCYKIYIIYQIKSNIMNRRLAKENDTEKRWYRTKYCHNMVLCRHILQTYRVKSFKSKSSPCIGIIILSIGREILLLVWNING